MLKFRGVFSRFQHFTLKPPIHRPIIPIVFRSIQITAQANAKLFVDNENRYAHQILQAKDQYHVVRRQLDQDDPSQLHSLDVSIDQDYSQFSHQEVLRHLNRVAKFCRNNSICISDQRFDRFVDHFTHVCFDLDDNSLIEALRILAHVPETAGLNTRNFVELWSVLDDACVERILSWDTDTILLVCDHWYLLNLGKVNKFNWQATKKLGRKLRKLETHQLVQAMFYCNLLRSPTVEMIDFEMGMAQRIDEMSLDEVAVMCMGFFKTQTSLKGFDLIGEIYRRLMRDVDSVQDISFVNIIKTLRYSSKPVHSEHMNALLDSIVPQIPRLSLMSCLHVLLLGSDIQLCHLPTIEPILHRFQDQVPNIRLKEIERISFVMGLFYLQSRLPIADQLSRQILGNLKTRVDEIMKYPRCFPTCLQYLAYSGYADAELISCALDERFCEMAYGRNVTLGRELFGLDAYAQINLKDSYGGLLLENKRRRTMGKILVHYIPTRSGDHKLSATDKILLEIKEAAERSVGDCHMAHVLPHYDRPDIIIAYDRRTGRSVDVAHRYPEHYSGTIITKDMLIQPAEQEHVVLINVIVGGWNNYVRNEERLTGLIEQKRIQSRLVGLVPVVVPWFEWTRLTKHEQTAYTRKALDEAIRVSRQLE